MISTLPLTSPQTSLENSGGKGLNLARLTRLGLPVPRGFILPTRAYQAYVEANGLAEKIHASIHALTTDDAAALETASQEIRSAFSKGRMPAEIQAALLESYADLQAGQPLPVAVRSSATTEDLPDLSFAGQQDTFLNVVGEEQLLQAVVNCWSSLWTARAIGYRLRNNISHAEAALAVIVQEMVPSEAAGVLFTANPLTGLRSESIINAVFGLGEALVSGQVEPDQFVVNAFNREIVAKTLGAKQVSTRSKAGGGVENLQENARDRQALSDEQILQLAALGLQIQQEFGAPQDIEWAYAGGKLYLLQTRPITSLFPVPRVSFDPLIVWFSFGAVQGLVGPMTPLGLDAIRHIVMGAGAMFAMKVRYQEVDYFANAGERLWVKISDVIRNPIGNRVFNTFLGVIEPSVGQILRPICSDPRLGAGAGKLKFRALRRLAYFFLPILARVAANMLHPDRARARFDAAIDGYLNAARLAPAADRFERLANLISYIKTNVANALPFLLPKFIPLLGPSMASLEILYRFSEGNDNLVLEATRGLPNNVTTQMDLALWETASAIRADVNALNAFQSSNATELAARYLNGALPAASQAAMTQFMQRYGMRGVGEIDLGNPRWREDPTPVIGVLQSYLQIDPQSAPDTVFTRGEKAAEAAIEKLSAAARRQRGGWLKEKIVRAAARRIRLLMGARESPKFFAIRGMGVARQGLLEAGQEFAAAGTIERADDLCFLLLSELEEMARGESRDWKALISTRRAAYQRELLRKQTPRVLVSDGRAYYEGVGADTDTAEIISGSPVSPGVVEGRVHVVRDPREARLAPGEILVCPGTDPSWTPLFMAAGGLITEVGGMMTHGSIVAREYGIPAVVGVHQATLRFKDGQKIRLDGSAGKIILLE